MRVVGAAAAAGFVSLGFAPGGWWPTPIFGLAILLYVLRDASTRVALLSGLAYGLVLQVATISWMAVIAAEATVALLGFEALWSVLMAWALARVLRGPLGLVLSAPVVLGVEWLASRFPFGGFPWLRLGYTQLGGPLSFAYPLVGTPGVGLGVALLAAGIVALSDGRPSRRTWIATATVLACTALAALGIPRLTAPPANPPESVRVGWVQGGAPGGGIYGIGAARQTTFAHLAETLRLQARIDAGELPKPDFLVWPENGTDMDPRDDPQTASALHQALAATKVPMLLGTMSVDESAYTRQTLSQWVNADGTDGDVYAKRNLVPFGEWVPLRSWLEPLFPKIAYVGEQGIPGTKPGVITGVLTDGTPLQIGVASCYDVAYDATMADTVTFGGQILVVQSSNAMYMGTGQTVQQFAITRVRALELQREILVVTTSGVSGLIRADGSVAERYPEKDPYSGVVTLPLRDNVTPATLLSGPVDAFVSAVGLGALLWGLWFGRRKVAKGR